MGYPVAITRLMYKNQPHIVFIMLDDMRRIVDFQMFEVDDVALINKVYVAKVEKVLPGINGAFVKFGPDKKGYLPLGNSKSPIYVNKYSKKEELCAGDEIIVQVIKDAIKSKDPVVSCDLSYYGNYCVVTSKDKSLSVSSKIDNDQREDIKELLDENFDKHLDDGYGLVIRTNAKNASSEDIINDCQNTVNKYLKSINEGIHKSIYSVLYDGPKSYISKLYGTNWNNIDKIITDQDDIYDELIATFPNSEKISKYEDDSISLQTLYNLNGQLEKLTSSKVWLNSGANIIIEQLETLTVIDINSSKNTTRRNDTILNVNIEAAVEIAKQIKLRNISGMIIIDFINMDSKEDESKLISVLKKEIAKDNVKCNYIDITKLGLVELTRKKVHKSLKEIV